MKNKNIGMILFLEAGLILIGLLSRWDYDTWKIIDSLLILLNTFLGFILIKKSQFKIKDLLKSKKIWTLIVVLIVMSIIYLIIIDLLERKYEEAARKHEEDRKCKFTLVDVLENRYQEDKDATKHIGNFGSWDIPAKHYTYWEIEGLLKNDSEMSQRLSGIVLKIYTNDGNHILLAENYLKFEDYLKPNQSLPFLIKANIDRTDVTLGKYFKKDDDVIIDVYPHFTHCDY